MLIGKKSHVFSYVPHWCDNRTQPEGSRLVLDLLPISRVERLAQESWTKEGTLDWIKEELPEHWNNSDYGPLFQDLPGALLNGFRQFVSHVVKIHNAEVETDEGTEEVRDPATLWLFTIGEIYDSLSLFTDGQIPEWKTPEEAARAGLVSEIQFVLGQTAILKGPDLKNFLSRCAFLSIATTTPTAANAAEGENLTDARGASEPST